MFFCPVSPDKCSTVANLDPRFSQLDVGLDITKPFFAFSDYCFAALPGPFGAPGGTTGSGDGVAGKFGFIGFGCGS